MKNKKILFLIVCTYALLFMTSCSNSSKTESLLDPKSPVTVTLWHYYVGENQKSLEQDVASFNQSEGMKNGVIVEAVSMGRISELEDMVTMSAKGVINAPPMPQIFSCYPDKAIEIDKLGMIADLNEYFTDEEKSWYIEDFLKNGIMEDGRFLVFPIAKSTELLYVNDTVWSKFADEVGYDDDALKEWESIYEAARDYYIWVDSKTPDVPSDGKGMIGIDSFTNYFIIGCKQLGLELINSSEEIDGQVVLDKAVMKRVFENYYKGFSLGYFNSVGKFRSDDIKSGDLISYVGSSSSASYFPTWIENKGLKEDMSLLALTYPVFNGGDAYAISQGAGMCIAKSTLEQQEGAALFIKWFTKNEQNIKFSMTTGYLPVRGDAYDSEDFTSLMINLENGDTSEQNLANVYDIALQQVIKSNTYSVKPFEHSYYIRTLIGTTLEEMAKEGREIVNEMRNEGMDEKEILDKLNVDSKFDNWVRMLKLKLERENINYFER